MTPIFPFLIPRQGTECSQVVESAKAETDGKTHKQQGIGTVWYSPKRETRAEWLERACAEMRERNAGRAGNRNADKNYTHPVQRDGECTIPLTRGMAAIVSDEDYARVSEIKWRAKFSPGAQKWYAVAHKPGSGKRGKQLLMHRFIMGAQDGMVVDHRSGDTLDNRRDNLRVCTSTQNVRNSTVERRNKRTSRFKGVYRLKDGKYRAQIMHQYVKINLGTFASEEAAARCYDANALKLQGEFARVNFPPLAKAS